MNRREVDDTMISEAFARRSRRAQPTGLAEAILARTSVTRQRGGIGARGRSGVPRFRLLAVAALVAGTIGSAVFVAGGQAPDPAPEPTALTETLAASNFGRPFTYRLDRASGLFLTEASSQRFTLLALPGRTAQPTGAMPAESWGIRIADATGARVHPCPFGSAPSRVPIGGSSTAILEDIEAVAGVAIGPLESGILDGRPSVSTRVDPRGNACEFADLHLSPGGIGSEFTRFDVPSILTATEVDGAVILTQVWATTDPDLDLVVPVGADIVESLDFS
jgi:hypothetical protein